MARGVELTDFVEEEDVAGVLRDHVGVIPKRIPRSGQSRDLKAKAADVGHTGLGHE